MGLGFGVQGLAVILKFTAYICSDPQTPNPETQTPC